MIDPLTGGGLVAGSALAGFVWELCKGALGNEADTQFRQIVSNLADKLQQGKLPANRHLERAGRNALQQACFALALGIEYRLGPERSWLQAIEQHLREKTPLRAIPPLAKLRGSPERDWLKRLEETISDDLAFDRLERMAIHESSDFSALLLRKTDSERQRDLHRTVLLWLDDRMQGVGGRPDFLNEFVDRGWPIDDAGKERLTFYQAWCIFFREEIKRPDGDKAFKVLVVETLAEINKSVGELHKVPVPSSGDFQTFLTGKFQNIEGWLERINDNLERIDDKLDALAQVAYQIRDNIAPRSDGAALPELPRLPEYFVGREEMVNRIVEDLRRAHANSDLGRLTRVIEGAGGLGKSVVAIAIGHALRADFPDPQFLVRLRTHSDSPVTPELARNGLLLQRHPSWDLPQDETVLWDRYHALFVDADGRPRRGVLILDDCKDDAQLEALTPKCLFPVIVTSRRALASGVSESITRLDPDSAARLLTSIYPDLDLPEIPAELATLCGYFPITLRAAARHLKRAKRKGRAIREYLAELRADPLRRLTDKDPDANTRLVLDYSYRDLDESDARALRALSIMQRDFDREAAYAVGRCYADTIDSLSELNLIEVDSDTGRLDWLDLLRVWVAGKASDEEREAAELLHVRHYTAVAQRAAEPFMVGREGFEASIDVVRAEHFHIGAAMSWLLKRPHLTAQRCALALGIHPATVRNRFRWETLDEWYRAAISSADGEPKSKAHALWGLGDTVLMRGQDESAQRCYEEALTIFQRIGDRSGEANARQGLGDVARLRGQNDNAQQQYEEALANSRAVDNRNGEANALWGLGRVARSKAENDIAQDRYTEALQIFQQIGNRGGQAYVEWGLGEIAHMQGHAEKAQAHWNKALAMSRAFDRRGFEADASLALGKIAHTQGEKEKARDCYQRALEIFREISDPDGEARALSGLGEIDQPG